MISLEEIKKLGLLARIELDNDEEKEFQKDLGAILDYVSQLQNMPTDIRQVSEKTTIGGAPEIFNVFREDESIKDESGVKKGEYVRVKHIL